MFDVYMEGQGVDPRTRARMAWALTASLAVTMSLGAMSWAAGKMSIRSVGAPQSYDVLELAMMPEAPRLEDPPERRDAKTDEPSKAVAAATTTKPARSEPVDTAPVESGPVQPRTPRSTNTGTGEGADDGVPGVPGPGGPGCIGVGCVAGAPPGIRTTTGVPVRKKDIVERKPLSVIKARAIYSPNPRASDLAKTKTGLGARKPGNVKVEFCVSASGKVSSAKVSRSFGSDPSVDRVCKEAVRKWRFKPARMGGHAKTTCSEVEFDIRFE